MLLGTRARTAPGEPTGGVRLVEAMRGVVWISPRAAAGAALIAYAAWGSHEGWTAAEFDTTRSGVMYIRKRISPSRRQTPSYQVLETYREIMTGKVKQRVLINLGACPDLQTALKEARQQRRQQKTAGTVPSKDLADRIRALERLISKWPRRLLPETTGRLPPVKPRSNDHDLAAARRVRERRIALGLSLQEMATRAGVSYQAAHKYETGVNRMSVGRLVTIAIALGTTASALLEEIELAKPRTGPGRLSARQR